ncbi:hypothetical protein FRZ67_14095 [Panacibacter ginsenosidivorans]|uniref:Nuclear transport factor 2 family protein n=1 Tax=Panacibacter ginsenosidivorans TaxID=1813871 RepID=A0A5B8VDM3_9BACT|nr:hypothetical protein [Panacibacter ginsenosidivorans]QEC68378.1 hypothetical protein FRZ67_14095 [Panacibacter ginsenosidivorans]
MMKSYLLSLAIAFTGAQLYAQQPIDKLIATEKSFAATSKEQTTKIAFLSFLDSNCIGYRNGEQVNLFEEYSKRKEDSSKLTWAPEFAIISSSGDLGATTGPWEYRQTSLKDTSVAHGHFATIWKKNDKGEWKAVFDMGIGYNEKINNNSEAAKLVLNKPKEKDSELFLLMNVDMNFTDEFVADKTPAIKKAVRDDSWFSINGSAPLKGATAIKASANILPAGIKFLPIDHIVVSKNTDMFAVYGKAQTGDTKQAHMRLWVKENNEWKLLMMVIH